MQEQNPFRAPLSRVADVAEAAGEFVAEGRRVPGGNGLAWISAGWGLFRSAGATWIALTVIFVLIVILLSMVPLLNLIVNLLMPVLMGGIMLGCKALDDGEELRISHLYAGFSEHAGRLLLVGVLYLVGMVLIVVAVILLMGVSGVAAFTALKNSNVGPATFLLPILAGLALGVPLMAAMWFAPTLVVLHDMSSFQAMKTSMFAALKNFLPFLVYGLAMFVLAIFATLPILLGWLLLAPTMYTSMYASYKDVFTRT